MTVCKNCGQKDVYFYSYCRSYKKKTYITYMQWCSDCERLRQQFQRRIRPPKKIDKYESGPSKITILDRITIL